jgi:murein DD-endopeptidase MepM/ murein hydrolase activator NlpD
VRHAGGLTAGILSTTRNDDMTNGATAPLTDSGLTRVSFELGPWGSPADPAWQQAYDEVLAGLAVAGRPVYAVLDPALAPTPLAERLRAGDPAEAEAWLEGYIEQAALVIARYGTKVSAFEVLPQPETTADRAPLVGAAWMARALTELHGQARQVGQSATARLVPCLPAGPQGGAAYLEALYAAGRANHAWATGGATVVPLDGVSVRLLLDLSAPPSAATAARPLAELTGALERIEGPTGAGKPVFVSGFVLAGPPDGLGADAALAAALQVIAADPRVYLAAQGTADMWPGAMPEPGEASRDLGESVNAGLEPTLVLFTPEAAGAARAGPTAEPPVVDGFDYPCWRNVADPWANYYIAADVCDADYFKLFKGVWHPGEDWNGKVGGDRDLGDPIYAIAHGVVVTAKYYATSWGNVVLVRHALPDGTSIWSQYAHLREMLVAEGDVVTRGQQVGTLGKGAKNKFPAHLHFEVRLADLPASNWFPLVRDKDKVQEHYAVGKDFIAARRPGQLTAANAVTVIVDEAGPGFQKADVPNWLAAGAGYGGGAWYTYGSRTAEANVGTWTAALTEPGTYQVAVYVPRLHATTENAVYTVTHANGQAAARVNQGRYYDQWVPIGTFPFGARGEVRLTDRTGESGALKREIAFDAIRWMKVA